MVTFALAGNPNSGKTTLFNVLTGSTARVGNWPGVTVDKREGIYKNGGRQVSVVDLPGIYSLSPYSPEERIARDFLLNEKIDGIINIVDATNLERNLYLTTQLMELDVPIIIALNMTDVLKKNGDRIDVRTLEKRIGIPIVEISALKQTNINVLMEKAFHSVLKKRSGVSILRGSFLGSAIEKAEMTLRLKGVHFSLFHAIKLVEKDELEKKSRPLESREIEIFIRQNVRKMSVFGEDSEAMIADERYKYITKYFSPTLLKGKKADNTLKGSEKADKILTHKIWGIPIFLVILFLVFHLTFSEDFLFLGKLFPSFGKWCAVNDSRIKSIFFSKGLCSLGVIFFKGMDWLTAVVGEELALGLESLGASQPIIALVCEGAWSGLASVLSFLPQVLLLFLLFSVLEDSGYMARVAFMLDRIFRRFGVSGRAFMPMIMGFGCSVPAIINTRTLNDEKERTATIRVIPFFFCGAKMPILLALSGGIVASFGIGNADFITYGMYVLGIITAMFSLFIMRHTTMRGEISPFIMELPAYHLPGAKSLVLHLWDKAKHFIQKAFTIILSSCIIVWFLSNFSLNLSYVGKNMDKSILALIGKWIQPMFTPLGFGSQLNKNGWVFAVAAITGLIAKEDVIATFSTLAACLAKGVAISGKYAEGVEEVMRIVTQTGIGVPALLSFLAFNMLTVPCFAAVAAAKGEIRKGRFKWTLLFWIAVSYIVSAMIYTIGEWAWTALIWAILGGVTGFGIYRYNKAKDL